MRGSWLASALFLLSAAAFAADGAAPVLRQGGDDRALLEAYLPADKLDALSPQQLSDIARAARDPEWPRRTTAFLQSAYGYSLDDWSLLSRQRQGLVYLDWERQRGDALQARRIVLLQGKPPTDAQARQMRLLAAVGFLEPGELRELKPLKTVSGAALLEASAVQLGGNPEQQQLAAARQFRSGIPGRQAPPLRVISPAPSAGVTATPKDDLEVVYRGAQAMVMDPAAFADLRSDLYPAPPSKSEAAAQARLRQKLGHLFTTASRLRAEGRLDIELAEDKDMDGSFGSTELVQTRDAATGAAGWKVVIKLNDKYKDADPALLAPTLIHELEHAYNDAQRAQRYGFAVARELDDFQEEEERAFLAESLLPPAYGSALRRAKAAAGSEEAAQLHDQVEMLLALEDVRSTDNQRFRARLKDVAYNLLRRNDYMKKGEKLFDLAGLRRETEEDLLEARAERVLVASGRRGVEKELARRDLDPRYKAHLLEYRHRGATESAESLDEKSARLRQVLRLIDDEKKRGLSLL